MACIILCAVDSVPPHTINFSKPVLMQQEYHNSTPSALTFSPLNAKLNPICHLLALLVAHHILHFSRVRVNPFVLNSIKESLCHAFHRNSLILIILARWRRWRTGGEWRCGPGRWSPRNGKMKLLNKKMILCTQKFEIVEPEK